MSMMDFSQALSFWGGGNNSSLILISSFNTSLFRKETFVWSEEQLPFRLGITCSMLTRLLRGDYQRETNVRGASGQRRNNHSSRTYLLVNVKLVGITFRPFHVYLPCSISGADLFFQHLRSTRQDLLENSANTNTHICMRWLHFFREADILSA